MSWVAVAASACFLLSIVAAAASTILEAVVVFDRVSHASAIWGELEPLEWAMLAIADLGFAFWLGLGWAVSEEFSTGASLRGPASAACAAAVASQLALPLVARLVAEVRWRLRHPWRF